MSYSDLTIWHLSKPLPIEMLDARVKKIKIKLVFIMMFLESEIIKMTNENFFLANLYAYNRLNAKKRSFFSHGSIK